jgi:hypothetical protein
MVGQVRSGQGMVGQVRSGLVRCPTERNNFALLALAHAHVGSQTYYRYRTVNTGQGISLYYIMRRMVNGKSVDLKAHKAKVAKEKRDAKKLAQATAEAQKVRTEEDLMRRVSDIGEYAIDSAAFAPIRQRLRTILAGGGIELADMIPAMKCPTTRQTVGTGLTMLEALLDDNMRTRGRLVATMLARLNTMDLDLDLMNIGGALSADVGQLKRVLALAKQPRRISVDARISNGFVACNVEELLRVLASNGTTFVDVVSLCELRTLILHEKGLLDIDESINTLIRVMILFGIQEKWYPDIKGTQRLYDRATKGMLPIAVDRSVFTYSTRERPSQLLTEHTIPSYGMVMHRLSHHPHILYFITLLLDLLKERRANLHNGKHQRQRRLGLGRVSGSGNGSGSGSWSQDIPILMGVHTPKRRKVSGKQDRWADQVINLNGSGKRKQDRRTDQVIDLNGSGKGKQDRWTDQVLNLNGSGTGEQDRWTDQVINLNGSGKGKQDRWTGQVINVDSDGESGQSARTGIWIGERPATKKRKRLVSETAQRYRRSPG